MKRDLTGQEWVKQTAHDIMQEGVRQAIEGGFQTAEPSQEPDNNPLDRFYLEGERSHTAFAKLVAEQYDGKLAFSEELNKWLSFERTHWQTSPYAIDFAIVELADKLCEIARDYLADAQVRLDAANTSNAKAVETEIKAHTKKLNWFISLKNDRPIKEVVSRCKRYLAISISEFDTLDRELNVANGTVNLETGELRAHDPADLWTLASPVEYDPQAAYPRWDQFLTETFGRPENIKFVQKQLGYCLTGLNTEELLIMLYGEPASGKSTFYEPIMTALGNYGRYMGFSTLKSSDKDSGGAPREDVLRLRTARVVMCSEINKNTHFDTALVKQICSGEPLVARGQHAIDSVEFRPKFKVVIGTNYQPIIPYDDGGSFRRIKVNPFSHLVSDEQRDKNLKLDFMMNPSAQKRILAWLIEGAILWHKEGLGNEKDEPREVKRANAAYRQSQNPLGTFLEDYCVLDPLAGKGTPGTTVAEFMDRLAPVRYAYGLEEITPSSFGKFMKTLGFEPYRKERERGYAGIRLKTAQEDFSGVEFEDIVKEFMLTADGNEIPCQPSCQEGELIKSEKEAQEEATMTDDRKKDNFTHYSTKSNKKNVQQLQNDGFSCHPSADQATCAAKIRQILVEAKAAKLAIDDPSQLKEATVAKIKRQLEYADVDVSGHYDKLVESDAEIQALIFECCRSNQDPRPSMSTLHTHIIPTGDPSSASRRGRKAAPEGIP